VSAATVLLVSVVIVNTFISDFAWCVLLRVARALALIDVLLLIGGVALFFQLAIVFVGGIGARISLGRLLLALRLSIRHLPSPRDLIARKR
jgi:hypothetical protein